MKNTLKATAALLPLTFSLVFLAPTSAQAELKTTGKGKKIEIDASQFSPEDQKRYAVFKARCTQCHAMQRPIDAIETGITPVSGAPFNPSTVKKYVAKMMRKEEAQISRKDAKEIVKFLVTALKKAKGD